MPPGAEPAPRQRVTRRHDLPPDLTLTQRRGNAPNEDA
jgi:hypothetical protein